MARNHEEVGRSLDGALAKTTSSAAEGLLAQRIRALPALRAEVSARVGQRSSTPGSLEPQLLAAVRRSQLAWTKFERDWQLPNGPVFRIPDQFEVQEIRAGRVAVRWNTSWDRIDHYSRGHRGHFELVDGVLVIPSWLFSPRRVRLSSIRTNEYVIDGRHRYLHLYGTNQEGVERELFALPTLYDAEFVCEVICHFCSARRDSHRLR